MRRGGSKRRNRSTGRDGVLRHCGYASPTDVNRNVKSGDVPDAGTVVDLRDYESWPCYSGTIEELTHSWSSGIKTELEVGVCGDYDMRSRVPTIHVFVFSRASIKLLLAYGVTTNIPY